ncbi:protein DETOXIFICATION [Salix suchowensis]|nr:protein DETOXIFICATION [Salix suchowensis]
MDLEEEKTSFDLPLISPESAIKSKYGFSKVEIVEEVKKQLVLAGPLITVNFLIFLLQVISVMFVGHLGELALSGASMATSFASVTGLSLLKGLASALDTYCGQSYGAKQYHMLGIHLQRAVVVLLLASVPLAIQDPEISAEAGRYARYMIPTIFGFAIQECHVRFLQSQNNVIPMMICAGMTTLLHIFTCWILVFKSGLGNKGAALANAISYWTNALLLILYVRISPSCKKTWTGLSKEALHGIPDFLKLAIPSAIMVSLEIWSFEMMVLLSGLLPNPKLETSVLSISLNTCALTYMIPLGISAAISTRVSNELGAGKPQAARLAVCVATFLVVTEGISVASLMIFGRNVWGSFYTTEKTVVKYVGELLVFVAVSHFFDGIQSVFSGTARGCGWQKIGAAINLGAYYLLGIPCSVILAFVYHFGGSLLKYGLQGLWAGLIVALVFQALALLVIILRTSWEKEDTNEITEENSATSFLCGQYIK